MIDKIHIVDDIIDLKEQERIRRLFTSKKNIVKWDIDKEA